VLSKWRDRFLSLAAHVATWSKDTTKVGAVAITPAKAVAETGYNGLPRGVQDLPERMSREPLPGHTTGAKYLFTGHAEENLVAHAARPRLEGTTVYVTHLCCAACTRMLINAGVGKIICGPGKTSMPQEQFDATMIMIRDTGIGFELVDEENPNIPRDVHLSA
jgi:dCMP deaminase